MHPSRLINPGWSTLKRNASLGLILAGLVAISLLAGWAFGGTPASLEARLQAWRLIPAPDNISELSFSRSADLPPFYTPKSRLEVAFSVRNGSQVQKSYRYRAQIMNGTSIRRIGEGTVTVPAGGNQTQKLAFTAPEGSKRVKLVIELPEENRTIHLWLEPTP